MDRKAKTLKSIDISKGKGLELGPLYSPVVLKSEAKIFYADHMSTKKLREKYEGHPFSVDEIVNVDFVITEKGLEEDLKGNKFDYVVASHVIEHIPDIVSWLKDIAYILKPGGKLSLVIPDKRYSFDISRNETSPSEVIGAYLNKLRTSTATMVYDSAVHYKEISPAQAWSDKSGKPYKEPSEWNTSEAIRRAQLITQGEYIDCHCYVFTPYSFFQVLKRLAQHDLLDFEVIDFSDTQTNELEFYVTLRKIRKTKTNKNIILHSIPKIKRPLQTQELHKKISILESQLHDMELSTSWRITRPLRKFKSMLSK